MDLNNCNQLPLVPFSGIWYRAIAPQYWPKLHSTAHTKLQATRFNAGANSQAQFEVLYLGENPIVTLYEVDAIYGVATAPIPNPSQAWCILNLDVRLDNIADLTDPYSQQLLQTTAQELTGSWQQYSFLGLTAPTQLLGVALYGIPNLQGFFAPSAKQPQHRNLVIFPQKLQPPRSRVLFTDPTNGQVHQVGSAPP